MVYKVTGVHRESGEPMTRVYEVETEREALDRAHADSMFVSEVKRVKEPNVSGDSPAAGAFAKAGQIVGAGLKSTDRAAEQLFINRKPKPAAIQAQPVLIRIDASAFGSMALAIAVGIALGSIFTVLAWIFLLSSLAELGRSMPN